MRAFGMIRKRSGQALPLLLRLYSSGCRAGRARLWGKSPAVLSRASCRARSAFMRAAWHAETARTGRECARPAEGWTHRSREEMRAGRVARGQVRGRGAKVWAGRAHDGLIKHVAIPLAVVLMMLAVISTSSVPFRALIVVSAVHGLSGHVADSVLAVSAVFDHHNSGP